MTPSAKWQSVVAELTEQIRSGRFQPGTQLPGVRGIEAEWAVSNTTAARVLRELVRAGLAVAVPGSGTYVADPLPAGTPRTDLQRLADLEAQVAALQAWRDLHERLDH